MYITKETRLFIRFPQYALHFILAPTLALGYAYPIFSVALEKCEFNHEKAYGRCDLLPRPSF